MKKEVLITKGLTEEQANYVLELYNTEIKDYVPKADYDLVNSKVETLENTVKERDKQLEGISKNIGDNEELTKQIKQLQLDNEKADKQYKAEISQLKVNNAIEMALTKAGAKTLKACKAMLDIDHIKLDKDGNITGLDEQIKNLTNNDDTKYLFNTEKFVGASIGNGSNEPGADTSKMNYTELCAYMDANPDAII